MRHGGRILSILHEIDRAMADEMAKLAVAPRDTQFLIVLNHDARNEYMQRFALGEKSRDAITHGIMGCKHLGAVLATTQDPDMPRVSIFTKVNLR